MGTEESQRHLRNNEPCSSDIALGKEAYRPMNIRSTRLPHYTRRISRQNHRRSEGNPTRLLWAYSDPHWTSGSAGVQNLSSGPYEFMIERVATVCRKHGVKRLTIVENGDLADIDREYWKGQTVLPDINVRPHHFEHQPREVTQVMRAFTIRTIQVNEKLFKKIHADEVKRTLNEDFGCEVESVEVIPIWGNHGNLLMLDPVARKLYAEARGIRYTPGAKRGLG